MHVLVSGSSGFVGSAVCERLEADRHTIVKLRRSPVNYANQSVWEPIRTKSWAESIGPVDAVVHLAGEPIARRRWSSAQKQRIYNSRVIGTRQLCEQLALLDDPPSVLISASAVGYYGDRGDEILTEESSPGHGFLAEVCRDWEAATQPAIAVGIRVVNLRIGMVLSDRGGALARMLPLLRFGLGGRLGRGRQYMSWISLEDLTGVIAEALSNQTLGGPVNAVSPEPVTNREFTRSLGRRLKRPTWFTVPGPILRLAAGEMADRMLLASTRVVPKKLAEHGFSFRHPDLDAALADL